MLDSIGLESEFHDSAAVLRDIGAIYSYLENPDLLPEDPFKSLYVQAIRDLKRGDHELALTNFITVLEKNRAYDDGGARRSCVAIFGMLGENHPVTRKYRRPFSNALYS